MVVKYFGRNIKNHSKKEVSQFSNEIIQDQKFQENVLTKKIDMDQLQIQYQEAQKQLDQNIQYQKNLKQNSSIVQNNIVEERLTKRLSRMGVCSRRQAEKMIEQGMISVDNKKIEQNMMVSDYNQIKIFTKHGGNCIIF